MYIVLMHIWFGVCRNIASTNKGFQMLSKLGWSKGQKLGKNETGILEPVSSHDRNKFRASLYLYFLNCAQVPLVSNVGTQGLGSEAGAAGPVHRSATANAKKTQQMRITQARYNQTATAAVAPAVNEDDPLDFGV